VVVAVLAVLVAVGLIVKPTEALGRDGAQVRAARLSNRFGRRAEVGVLPDEGPPTTQPWRPSEPAPRLGLHPGGRHQPPSRIGTPHGRSQAASSSGPSQGPRPAVSSRLLSQEKRRHARVGSEARSPTSPSARRLPGSTGPSAQVRA
jgi:hypothetical protein